MKYVEATSDMANGTYNVLHTVIKTVYPNITQKKQWISFVNTIVKNTSQKEQRLGIWTCWCITM